jgi:hypothetical protein
MENEKETKLEASGRFAEIGAMQIKEAAPSPKPPGRFAHLSGIEVKPAIDESEYVPNVREVALRASFWNIRISHDRTNHMQHLVIGCPDEFLNAVESLRIGRHCRINELS